MALTYGAWISQDNVRKANRGGLCFGHTDKDGGCEVGPENYGLTARNLKLNFDEWDFTQLAPQAPAFKKWIKSHLVKGEPVMWAPILKNHEHTLYGRVASQAMGISITMSPSLALARSTTSLTLRSTMTIGWFITVATICSLVSGTSPALRTMRRCKATARMCEPASS